MSEKIIESLKTEFIKTFGDGDMRLFFAPGRVNMIGEHTDYNGGHVFPCALTLGTYGVIRKREDDKLKFTSLNIQAGKVYESSLPDLKYEKEDDWTNYAKGVFWAYLRKGCKIDKGADIMISGNIPAGSGLSSSASLEVLIGLMIRELYGFDNIDMVDVALLGQKAESEFVGMNCGIMDQFASAMGKEGQAIFLDTSTLEYDYAPLELKDAHIVITNSNVKHELASSEYNTRRNECREALKDIQAVEPEFKTLGEMTNEDFERLKGSIKEENVMRRARHAVGENIRAIDAVEALKANDIEKFGRLMNASHVSLRDDYEVSCPELDYLASLAWETEGVIGSRMTGGGFGGCTVSIIKNDAIDGYKKKVSEKYKEKYGLDAEFYVIDPGEGAHEIK
ncbi:MAG: galactokinase [Lachnospiraceae bacterium]|nr:galactokinase [Lachnospiraceae bacterium]